MEEVLFKLERDNRPLIEKFDKNTMKDKFFYRQYSMAIRCIARYLECGSGDGSLIRYDVIVVSFVCRNLLTHSFLRIRGRFFNPLIVHSSK